MSVILVVEQDASRAQRLSGALQRDGFSVVVAASRAEAHSSAERSAPNLLLANSALSDAAALVADFSRSRGGPGAIVLVEDPDSSTSIGSPSIGDQADGVLVAPFSDDQLRELVHSCMVPPAPSAEAPRESSKSEQLTSEDIFGDVLAEVEAEARDTGSIPVSRKSAPPMADIERRLEETLSGVLPTVGKSKRPSAGKARPTDSEIDSLLDQTLSSLDIPTRKRKSPAPRPTVQMHEVQANEVQANEVQANEVQANEVQANEVPANEVPVHEARHEDTSAADPSPDFPAAEPTSEQPISEPPASETWNEEPVASEPSPDPVEASIDAPIQVDFEPLPDFPPIASEKNMSRELVNSAADLSDTDLSDTGSFAAGTGSFTGDTGSFSGETGTFSQGAFVPELPQPKVADPASSAPPRATVLDDLHANADQFRTQALSTAELAAKLQEAAASNDAARSLEGDRGEAFGDYSLLDRIATGGMAEVWRARRSGVEGFQKTVAIKKILSHLTGSKDFVTMFIDEAKLAAQLSHNNIIQIYDLGKVGDDFFIAMEHVDGKDLRSILSAAQESSRPVPLDLSLLIVSAVARALDYAHRKRDFDGDAMGLVHRDVSPQNVMISYEGAIKLCDFGIVKAVAKASTTQMGALKGKLQYMSPEQAWGKTVDARSDIFSLGSVFYEVLTGKQLFSGESEISVLDSVRECKISSPRELVPEIPEEVARIVLKALAKSPEERFQTAGELEHEIRAVSDNLRPTPSHKSLAGYLKDLFEIPKSGAIALPAPSPAESAPPAAEALPAAPAVTTEAPAEEPAAPAPAPAEKEAGTGRWKWLAAAVLVAALAGAGILAPSLLRRDAEPTPAAPAPLVEAPPPAVTPAPLEDAAAASANDPTSQSADPTESSEDPNGDDSTGTDEPAETAEAEPAEPVTTEDPADPDANATAGGIDIEQMVNEELTSRAEQLRRDFEAEKQRLERELAQAQDSEQPDEDTREDGGGGN